MISFLKIVAAQFTLQVVVAVAIAAVAGMVIGAIYYTLFGSFWRRAASVSEDAARSLRSVKTCVIAALCYTLLALALLGIAWHASSGLITLRTGLIAALLAWLGFVVSTTMANYRFQGRPFTLTIIDSFHWLFVLLSQGLIIGLLA